MWPYGQGAGWCWKIGGWIMMVVFWGLVIVGIVALVRVVRDRGAAAPPRSPKPLSKSSAGDTRQGSSPRSSSRR
jgi:hypothetical protein